MKARFDHISRECSKLTTKAYSTSFSLGILFLHERLRGPIYSIYGFVRFADEIVDSFHDYNKRQLFQQFRIDTETALRERISLNPILNAFQEVVHQYAIRKEWINLFMDSMEMDLQKMEYNGDLYNSYILGSAEVVGLMCLHVFTEGDEEKFRKLQPYAMRLGAAFQKVNFLRDMKSDHEDLGRLYFPEIDLKNFTAADKLKIEIEIEDDFKEALKGIRMLPPASRNGVHLAYRYYLMLFRKIKQLPPHRILQERIRIPNSLKILMMCKTQLRYQFNLL
jgi:phytoene/squalene synthetase